MSDSPIFVKISDTREEYKTDAKSTSLTAKASKFIAPVRRAIPVRDYLTINPDSHADYILRQTLISNVVESYNMPKLYDTKKYDTRSKVNSEKQKQQQQQQQRYAENPKLNMASPPVPATLEEKDKIITEKQKKDPDAVVNALNQIYFLVKNNQTSLASQESNFEEKFSQLNTRIDTICEGVDTVNQRLGKHDTELKSLKSDKASKSDLKTLERTLASVKLAHENKFVEMEREQASLRSLIHNQERALRHMDLEMRRMAHDLSETNERINVLEINNKHLTLTVENIPEEKNVSPASSFINRLNTDAELELSPDIIKAAHRVGKFRPKAKQPRQIKIIVDGEKARESILACRGKLKPNADKSYVWINESYPEDYRRRKTIMRDLVKRINTQGLYKASIEAGGIKLDDQLYMPDQFHSLPDNCHPEIVQSLDTDKGGLAFAGEWIYLSNMYRCQFEYNEIMFHSVEQCFQYHKALAHGKEAKAERILLTKNPFYCKRTGESIHEKKVWLDSMEDTLYKILMCKFVQNEALLDRLLDTGDQKLYEATRSSIWGIGSNLKAKETKEESGQDDNVTGRLLEKLRAELKSK